MARTKKTPPIKSQVTKATAATSAKSFVSGHKRACEENSDSDPFLDTSESETDEETKERRSLRAKKRKMMSHRNDVIFMMYKNNMSRLAEGRKLRNWPKTKVILKTNEDLRALELKEITDFPWGHKEVSDGSPIELKTPLLSTKEYRLQKGLIEKAREPAFKPSAEQVPAQVSVTATSDDNSSDNGVNLQIKGVKTIVKDEPLNNDDNGDGPMPQAELLKEFLGNDAGEKFHFLMMTAAISTPVRKKMQMAICQQIETTLEEANLVKAYSNWRNGTSWVKHEEGWCEDDIFGV
jgi:hypothetical protein